MYLISNQAYFILLLGYFIKLALQLQSSITTILKDSFCHSVFGKPWEVGFGWQDSCCQTSSEGACLPLSDLPTLLQVLKFSQWRWRRLKSSWMSYCVNWQTVTSAVKTLHSPISRVSMYQYYATHTRRLQASKTFLSSSALLLCTYYSNVFQNISTNWAYFNHKILKQ